MTRLDWVGGEWLSRTIFPRLAFQDRIATGLLVLTLLLWYVVQLGVVVLGGDRALIQWLFTTDSFPAPSPGLVVAGLSHTSPMHLLGNVALLWLFAGDSEQHLRRLGVIGCFLVTAVTAVLVGTALSGKSTMGASGGVFGFIGFYCVHMALEHRDTLEFDALADGGLGKVTFRICWSITLVALPVALLVALVGQLVGLVPVGRADVVGHLTGLLCGIGCAVAHEHL